MDFFSKILSFIGPDRIASVFGIIAGISQLHGFSVAGLVTGNPDDIFKLGGAIALVIWGLVTNKPTPITKAKIDELIQEAEDKEDEETLNKWDRLDPAELRYLNKVKARVNQRIKEQFGYPKGPPASFPTETELPAVRDSKESNKDSNAN